MAKLWFGLRVLEKYYRQHCAVRVTRFLLAIAVLFSVTSLVIILFLLVQKRHHSTVVASIQRQNEELLSQAMVVAVAEMSEQAYFAENEQKLWQVMQPAPGEVECPADGQSIIVSKDGDGFYSFLQPDPRLLINKCGEKITFDAINAFNYGRGVDNHNQSR